ncbi:MAG TPA: chemotaxis protein CheD [bacterium (Candidatus Stahlbacteria)]|nr:chemotaxis protein CheD [Candidatus Stahlbacteria bacterium]
MRIGIGEIGALRNEGEILSSGIGSCVLVVLYDSNTKVGGAAHILLPDERYSKSDRNENRFPKPAIINLLKEMERLGAEKTKIFARLIGGSSMFETDNHEPIGNKNVSSCRQVLTELGVPITGEDTGGTWGRSVNFNIETGKIKVTTYRIGIKEL